jgi:hypothetical protein
MLSPDGHGNMRRIHVDHKDVKPEVFEGFNSGDYPRIKFGVGRSGFKKNIRRFGNRRWNLKISSPPSRY